MILMLINRKIPWYWYINFPENSISDGPVPQHLLVLDIIDEHGFVFLDILVNHDIWKFARMRME